MSRLSDLLLQVLLHPFHLAEVGGIAAKAKDIEEVKALTINGQTAQEAVTQRSGITGEKMELDGYLVLEGENIEVYDHMGKHTLCTMVQIWYRPTSPLQSRVTS